MRYSTRRSRRRHQTVIDRQMKARRIVVLVCNCSSRASMGVEKGQRVFTQKALEVQDETPMRVYCQIA